MTVTLREHRYFETEQAKKLFDLRVDNGYPKHLAPWSTLVSAMGNHWQPGSYEAVKAMADYTFDQGIQLCFYEQQDLCYQPYDALGTMRNEAYLKAIAEGYEFVLYVDNDVLPERDVLFRLLQRFVPIVTPVLEYTDGSDHGLTIAKVERGRGLAMVGSVPISFILFRTAVFLPWATAHFWADAIGAGEEYHFHRLRMAGHAPFVDTDQVVKVLGAPHFPLDHRPGLPKDGQNGGLWIPK